MVEQRGFASSSIMVQEPERGDGIPESGRPGISLLHRRRRLHFPLDVHHAARHHPQVTITTFFRSLFCDRNKSATRTRANLRINIPNCARKSCAVSRRRLAEKHQF